MLITLAEVGVSSPTCGWYMDLGTLCKWSLSEVRTLTLAHGLNMVRSREPSLYDQHQVLQTDISQC